MGIFVRVQKSTIEAEPGHGCSSSSSSPQRKERSARSSRASPCREVPRKERTITEQILSLSIEEKAVLLDLKVRWSALQADSGDTDDAKRLTDELILRFARANRFDEGKAWTAMNRFDQRYLSLTAEDLKRQLGKKMVFPLPGVTTRDGCECFYIRHSRFHPSLVSVEDAIDPLAYVMNSMCEKEGNATKGIALISNFAGWTVEQFSMEYFVLLTTILQGGAVPVVVTSWLIVNAPPFFDRFYAMMKRMMTSTFQRRVHFVSESRLGKHLKGGYQAYLPHDVASGLGITKEMVWDFYDARRHLESQRQRGQQQQQKGRAPPATPQPSKPGAVAAAASPAQRRRASANTASTCGSCHDDDDDDDSDHSTAVTWLRKK